MASYSDKNVSRDFWRFANVPVVPCHWLNLHFFCRYLFSFSWRNRRNYVLCSCCSAFQDKFILKAPLKSARSGYEIADLEVVDPISLVSYLWNDVGIRVGEEEVKKYWRHHRQFGAKWALHSEAPENTVPLGIYGDAVKVRSTYQGVEKMIGIFLNCPLYRPRSCRCSRWLLFACQEELLYKHHTLDCVYLYLVWCLNQLYTGKYPTRGFRGASLSAWGATRAGQWVCNDHLIFQVTEIRGDWAWHKAIFRFNSSWKAGSNFPVCFQCRAYGKGTPHELYYNIEENSPCWQTEYGHVAEFIAEQCPRTPCHLDLSHCTCYCWFIFSFPRLGCSDHIEQK